MSATPETLGRALAAAPDPVLARVAISRVGEKRQARAALAMPGVLEAAARLLGFSTAAADFLVAHPEETRLFGDLTPRGPQALLEEAAEAVEREGPASGLRRFRRRAIFRVAARDLEGAPFEVVVAEITTIAETLLQLALAELEGPPLAVLGMGKLGGEELNYASDVDVIFVHPDGADQQAAARRATGLIALLSEPTADGIAVRVDADLRPEGRAAPLSRSLASTLGYYRRHAATWERQAMLKARPVAGDGPLGEELVRELTDVVYPEHLEEQAIEDVRSMKVRLEEYVRARGKESVEVKRGRGGIRDVEFAVQLLQVVHGRRNPRLRSTNTLRALSALADEGYVASGDAQAMRDSYRFLRTLEHRLQIARDLQTHELPEEPSAVRRLARSMGYANEAALASAYALNTSVVRGLHERLFYRPLLEAFAGPRTPRPGVDRVATEELLGGLGFRDAPVAYGRLARAVDPATRLGRVLGAAFPLIAPALALSPQPDAALVRLERIAEGWADDAAAADALAADPEAARRLALVAGRSRWLSDLLALDPGAVTALGGGVADTLERRLVALGAAYLGGALPVPEVGRHLSAIADDVVREALDTAAPGRPLAVIGLGKLGGEEMNFASDLDVMFVFEGEGAADFQEAERAAERVLAGIRDAGFEADPDLRPEGRNGPLARSLAAFLEYWQRWGQTWEFQSLLKARHVAGDEALARRFLSSAQDLAYPEALPIDRVAEIRRMRVRMETERVKPADARRFHLKLGTGGLADVQFSVELQLMRHGHAHPEIRRRHTLEALESLAAARLIEDSVSLALGEAYVFLNEIKNAMEIDRRVAADALPPTPEGMLSLARQLGYEEVSRRRFLEDYRRVTRRARNAMERVFYGAE